MPEYAESMQEPTGAVYRRVSFTARFYRKECKQGKEGICKWREAQEKRDQIMYIQLIPGPGMFKDPMNARFDALLTVDAQISLEKLFKMISVRCRLPKDRLSVRMEPIGEVDAFSWPRIRDIYQAELELSPALQLAVVPRA